MSLKKWLMRPSLLVLVGVTFFAFFLLMTTFQHFYYAEAYYSQYNIDRMNRLMAQMKMVYALFEEGRDQVAREDLVNALSRKEIDFYRVEQAGKVTAEGGRVPLGEFVVHQVVVEEDSGYIQIQVGDQLVLAGIHYNFSEYHWMVFDRYRDYIIRDSVFLAIILVLTVVYFFRDIWKMLSAVTSGDLKKLDGIASFSEESEALKKSLSSYNRHVQEVKSENLMLKDQILPALKSELYSGLKPPYDFSCALVRTDINHFSSILKSHDKVEFLKLVDAFFTRCTHMISRYNGVVSEFLGDEIIYYFKQKEGADACLLALSCLRQIDQIAQDFHQMTVSEQGHPFQIKSAVSFGELHFGKQVDRHTVSGEPLIETVRVLSQISSRSENTTWVSGGVAERCGALFEFVSLGVFDLKGLARTELFELSRAVELAELSAQHQLEQMEYYRSDQDYIFLLERLQGSEWSSEEKMMILGHCRTHPPIGGADGLRQRWMSMLTYLSRESQNRLFPAMIGASRGVLISPLEPSERSFFVNCLGSSEYRAVANTIELLSALGHGEEALLIRSHLKHSHHRVQVAAMVYLLKRKWERSLAKRLSEQLQSELRVEKATAFWGLRQIHEHYAKHHPVLLESNADYIALLELAENVLATDSSLSGFWPHSQSA